MCKPGALPHLLLFGKKEGKKKRKDPKMEDSHSRPPATATDATSAAVAQLRGLPPAARRALGLEYRWRPDGDNEWRDAKVAVAGELPEAGVWVADPFPGSTADDDCTTWVLFPSPHNEYASVTVGTRPEPPVGNRRKKARSEPGSAQPPLPKSNLVGESNQVHDSEPPTRLPQSESQPQQGMPTAADIVRSNVMLKDNRAGVILLLEAQGQTFPWDVTDDQLVFPLAEVLHYNGEDTVAAALAQTQGRFQAAKSGVRPPDPAEDLTVEMVRVLQESSKLKAKYAPKFLPYSVPARPRPEHRAFYPHIWGEMVTAGQLAHEVFGAWAQEVQRIMPILQKQLLRDKLEDAQATVRAALFQLQADHAKPDAWELLERGLTAVMHIWAVVTPGISPDEQILRSLLKSAKEKGHLNMSEVVEKLQIRMGEQRGPQTAHRQQPPQPQHTQQFQYNNQSLQPRQVYQPPVVSSARGRGPFRSH